MANLKQDLLNNLGNEKYYDEIELIRLAQDPNITYKDKIELMIKLLKNISSIDLSLQLVGKYFQEPQQKSTQDPQMNAPITNKPQPGQTHAE